MEAFLGANWPSEATLKASVIKYANKEGPRSINYLPPGKHGEPHRPMLPLTGSADDGKRSALYVLVDRGYQGDSSIQSFGLATPGRGRRIFWGDFVFF